ncbi:MAG: GntR family transcriptional regulator [bacterium]
MNILNVTTSAHQFLRDKIITGELGPGEKLNEAILSTKLGISRPPLRESFRLLEKDHMVVNIPRKGTYVTELSTKDFVEGTQIREILECFAIDLLKASDIRDMPKVTLALNKALNLPVPFNRVDPEQLLNNMKVFLDFHNCLVESSGNSRLTQVYHSVMWNLARYQFIYFCVSGTVRRSLADHKRTLELIQNGSYEKAKEQLKEHIDYTGVVVKDRISDPAISRAGSS